MLPLVIGMVACLLLLGAGVTAATSAFLARGNLQHSCDGAAAAAADIVKRMAVTGALTQVSDADAASAAAAYLQSRRSPARVDARVVGDAVEAACSVDAPIAFGALFGVRTLSLQVDAVGRSVLTPAGP